MAKVVIGGGDVQGAVLSVLGRNTNGGRTVYDVAFSNGKTYSTFDAQLAQQGQALQSQQGVTLRYEVSQNGQYTNENVVGLFPPGMNPGTFSPPQQQASIPMGGTPTGIPMASGGGGGMSAEDKARLTRLSSASTAFEFVGALLNGLGPESVREALGFARQLTEEINAYGMTGQWPSGIQPTPLGVALGVPGVQVGVGGIADPNQQAPTQTTGNDIPWGQPQQ